ncbi:MAG: carbohydrate ABC transporter substrate-binding protein [Phycisphaerales bacterium]|jgi:arabinosaccharide transport system substrate-binding protein|nr:carbohydrate ABC transporter substrate-binding protein [Phycisphaerales bacterium]
MNFFLPKPIALMGLLAIVTGLLVMVRPESRPTDLTVWTFAPEHARMYRDRIDGRPSLVEQYELLTGKRVDVRLLSANALDVRLLSLIHSNGRDVPDLVEIEIGSIGKYFRAPMDRVGLLPLNGYLQQSGLLDQIVPWRLAPWTKNGVLFGVPHDVHPVSLVYRKDLFDEAGIDLASAKTWVEFHKMGLRFQRYWRDRGISRRWAMELPQSSADILRMMLQQRRIHPLGAGNSVHLDEAGVARTVLFYAQLVAGPGKIGEDASAGEVGFARDLARGELCSLLMPDWRVDYLREFAPELAGKMAMMPLPRFEANDAPTATWGGTMMGIVKNSADTKGAWELLRFLQFSPQALEVRRRTSDILPPLKGAWENSAYHRPDAYFGGQKIEELYVQLAGQIPPSYSSPYAVLASAHLSAVLNRTVREVEAGRTDGLEEKVRVWLSEAAGRLREQIRFGEFPS